MQWSRSQNYALFGNVAVEGTIPKKTRVSPNLISCLNSSPWARLIRDDFSSREAFLTTPVSERTPSWVSAPGFGVQDVTAAFFAVSCLLPAKVGWADFGGRRSSGKKPGPICIFSFHFPSRAKRNMLARVGGKKFLLLGNSNCEMAKTSRRK